MVFRDVGQRASITSPPPPPGNSSPTQRKTSIKHGQRVGVRGAHNPWSPPGPPNGGVPNICMPTWGVSLCIFPSSVKLIFALVILKFKG